MNEQSAFMQTSQVPELPNPAQQCEDEKCEELHQVVVPAGCGYLVQFMTELAVGQKVLKARG